MSIARHHAEWLSLTPVSGPFLSLPVLQQAFPQGLDAHDPDGFRLLRQAYEEWDAATAEGPNGSATHEAWARFVLTQTLEHDEANLVAGPEISQTLQVELPEHGELLRPSLVLLDPADKRPRLLVKHYPRSQSLAGYVGGSRWKASPDTRMTELLRGAGVRLGLVTNGEQWMLVDAPKGETAGYASWYAPLWLEEKITLQAFRSLLSAQRFFGVADDETLEGLLAKSAGDQQEVTDQLGKQVLRAVEVLIQSLDRADQDNQRVLLAGVPEAVLYESALTVMMRLVFLFCAEERELIPTKPFPVYEENYSVSTISKQLRETADQHGEELLERRFDAWPRLLATFRAVYGGVSHDQVYLPAYGGGLFAPDRFPFLEGRPAGTTWKDTPASPLPVNNRTTLHLLEALQLLQINAGRGAVEARRLSFRALDIEQIGHVYEGLLDHTAKRAGETFLGLIGKTEPEIPLARIEEERAKGEDKFAEFLKKQTGGNRKWQKYLDQPLDDHEQSKLLVACGNDAQLAARVAPYAKLLRADTLGFPVVVTEGSVFVTAGMDRRSSGTHYTPRSLTEPIVQYTLEPLVYVGPAEGAEKKDWKLKPAAELLELNICDMACGSGAFLVQAARYMAARLLEAWDAAAADHPDAPGVTPLGEPAIGERSEQLIPSDPAERTTYAMRLVAQRCLYGVDINPLAVEMAKLSLWLLTLARDKPFEFLDHAIRCGDSLVGIHNLEQLKHFSLKPEDEDAVLFYGPLLEGVDEAVDLRLQLEAFSADTFEGVKQQVRLHREAEDKIARLRCAADLLVSAEFWGEGAKDKQERVRHAAVVAGHYVEHGPTEEFVAKATSERQGQRMFHWPLEFPEVFTKGGFHACIGNPPFVGGKRISTSCSSSLALWIRTTYENGRNTADLCAYFFQRCHHLLSDGGALGLLATDSVSDGDSARVAFVPALEAGGTIFLATTSFPWPGAASVVASLAHLQKGGHQGERRLNGSPVGQIDAHLVAASGLSHPKRLCSAAIPAFVGSFVRGEGFIISPQEAEDFLRSDPRNADVVFPYLTGEDLCQSAGQHGTRFIINFFDWPLGRAESYLLPIQTIVERVRPFRAKVKEKAARSRWWQYAGLKAGLYRSLQNASHAFVRARVSSTHAIMRVDSRQVFSDQIVVFGVDGDDGFGILQSCLHEEWVSRYSSTLGGTIRYSPTECFETFPFPDRIAKIDCFLEVIAAYEARRELLLRDEITGLTSLYNSVDLPSERSVAMTSFRDVIVDLDGRASLAYGWDDLDLCHDFHETKQGIRFTISEPARREVLQRLLKLNHERYAEEVRQGLHEKKKGKKPAAKRGAKRLKENARMLFDGEGA
ncbi:hypothetical protein Pla175_17730 [Pirellulimonas nuda]|uniref:site-specific DNA-methyltransferase (adenine-specific) n=1 Tax=Pirellulimonas nuda TaxID=2528009 RepID=A0A518DA80_9BACT|nr:DNA methyltransferase [Pirellulimonas nuda]QDU88397.1 hypothetical protein Pla175_17730 [Pirellulimonas nuda]